MSCCSKVQKIKEHVRQTISRKGFEKKNCAEQREEEEISLRATKRVFWFSSDVIIERNSWHALIRARSIFFDEIGYALTTWNTSSCSQLQDILQQNIYWVYPE